MSRSLLAALFLLAAPLLAQPAFAQEPDEVPSGAGKTASLAVSQIVEHPALDAVRRGLEDSLAKYGWVPGQNLAYEFETAQGNQVVAGQIAQKFVGDRPDAIVAIGTPAAQAVAATTRDIPVIFSAVTDPLGAKLVKSMEAPGGNVTGVSDLSPVKLHMDMIARALPTISRLGVLYNPGEVNSQTLLGLVREEADNRSWTLVEGAAPSTAGVLAAARSLVGKVDAIYVPTDNTIVAALEAVVKVGQDAEIPVFAGDVASVERGAVAALGFDYYDVGRKTGEIVARVLGGTPPGDIPVAWVEDVHLHINMKAARAMGILLPADLVNSAKKVYE